MQKKLLIFGYTMDMGGAERALINVINVMKKYFEIDLILIKDTGVLMKDIPEEVNVKKIRKNIFQYILFRFFPYFRKKIINKLANKKYDLAVAFMEGRCATWLIDLDQDCKKIGWIHNDVLKFDIGIPDEEIKDTYSKLDKIVIVSKKSRDSFCNKYNIPINKTEVIYNLIDEENILKLACEEKISKKKFTFINVSKMRPQKRHDRLLEAASILKKEGFEFDLWLIGNGPLEEKIKSMIKDLNLENYVTLFGLLTNPFPYMKEADFFVMSSDHEGYPLTLLESLLLKTPVLSTDVSGAKEILQDGKYGIICDVSLESLTNAMREILKKKKFSNLENNLENYKGTNENIIKELKKLFDVR